jgi:hypothetical protein
MFQKIYGKKITGYARAMSVLKEITTKQNDKYEKLFERALV